MFTMRRDKTLLALFAWKRCLDRTCLFFSRPLWAPRSTTAFCFPMATNSAIQAGCAIAEEAVRADHAKKAEEATHLYARAIQMLSPYVRNKAIPTEQRNEMIERIQQYKDRVRALERALPAQRYQAGAHVRGQMFPIQFSSPRHRNDPSAPSSRATRLESPSVSSPRPGHGATTRSPHLATATTNSPRPKLSSRPHQFNTDGRPAWEGRVQRKVDTPEPPPSPWALHQRKKAEEKEAARLAAENGGGTEKKPMSAGAQAYEGHLEASIMQDLLEKNLNVRWQDIAGLDKAKQTLQEAVILPALRPDLFNGLRAPPRGVLLFGPPGTGKTMLAKCVATESKACFFNISASSLTSKWHGEGEKLVKKMFEVARKMQPSVIFIDEIDSLLSSRREKEHDAVRLLKTEFLVHLDGAGTNEGDRVLIMGATNRPDDLDDAMIRRLQKRIYIGLPERTARMALVKNLLQRQPYDMSDTELEQLVRQTEGFSGSDLSQLCREAAFGPIRELGSRVMTAAVEDIRLLQYKDFTKALEAIRPSVSQESLGEFAAWSKKYSST